MNSARDPLRGTVVSAISLTEDSRLAGTEANTLLLAIKDGSLGVNRLAAGRENMIMQAVALIQVQKDAIRSVRILKLDMTSRMSGIISFRFVGTGLNGEMTVQKDITGLWMIQDLWIQENPDKPGDDPERLYPEENVRILQERGALP